MFEIPCLKLYTLELVLLIIVLKFYLFTYSIALYWEPQFS